MGRCAGGTPGTCGFTVSSGHPSCLATFCGSSRSPICHYVRQCSRICCCQGPCVEVLWIRGSGLEIHRPKSPMVGSLLGKAGEIGEVCTQEVIGQSFPDSGGAWDDPVGDWGQCELQATHLRRRWGGLYWALDPCSFLGWKALDWRSCQGIHGGSHGESDRPGYHAGA